MSNNARNADATATARCAGLTAEQRWNDINHLIQESFNNLATKGGFVLTATQRVHVAKLTLKAVLDNTPAIIPKDVCLQPGTDLYKTIMELNPSVNNDPIVHMIQSIVNYQERIFVDPTWYESTMKALKAGTNLLDVNRLEHDGFTSDQQLEYLYYGLFVELVMIISGVHGLHMVTIMLKGNDNDNDEAVDHKNPFSFNIPSPKVLEAITDATPPSYFDWSKVFLNGKTATRNNTFATMPYISKTNINPNSPLLVNLIPNEVNRASLFDPGMIPFAPFLCTTWNPIDYLWMNKLSSVLYVDDVFNTHLKLKPSKRCTDYFTRYDVEIVAVGVTTGYNCQF